MAMAFGGNSFALLGGDDEGDVENLLAGVAKAPLPAVEKRTGNEKGRDVVSERQNRNGNYYRHNKNGNGRHNGKDVERYVGQENGSRQNNRGGSSFKRNNQYRNEERPANSLEQHQQPGDRDKKKEEVTDDDGWQRVVRPSRHKQNNVDGFQPRRFRSSSNEVGDHRQAPRRGNVGGRNYGWRRVFKGENSNGSEAKEQDRVSGGVVEELSEGNVNKDEKGYRIKNWNSGGNNRVNRGGYRGYRNGGAGEGNGSGGKDNGKTSESTESLEYKDVQKDKGNADARSEGIDVVAAEASKESEKHDQVLRQERAKRLARLAERELEAKRMTLKEYEKKRQGTRKVLESMKTQERKVTLDKDFESMLIIGKKNEDTIFVKLNSDNDNKLKKKFTIDKDENNVHKPLVTNFKPAGTNYSGRRGGRYGGREEDGNGGYPGGKEDTGSNPSDSKSVKKEEGTPPSFEDAKQFPVLALNGSPKP